MMILTKEPIGDHSRYVIVEIIGHIAVYDHLTLFSYNTESDKDFIQNPRLLIRNI